MDNLGRLLLREVAPPDQILEGGQQLGGREVRQRPAIADLAKLERHARGRQPGHDCGRKPISRTKLRVSACFAVCKRIH